MAKKTVPNKLSAEQMRLIVLQHSDEIAELNNRVAALEKREPATASPSKPTAKPVANPAKPTEPPLTESRIREIINSTIAEHLSSHKVEYDALTADARQKIAASASSSHSNLLTHIDNLDARVKALEPKPEDPTEKSDNRHRHRFKWQWLIVPLYPIWWLVLGVGCIIRSVALWLWDWLCNLFKSDRRSIYDYGCRSNHILYWAVFIPFFIFLFLYLRHKYSQ